MDSHLSAHLMAHGMRGMRDKRDKDGFEIGLIAHR